MYEQILQLYPDESLQKKKAAKLEPMTIPRRRRPAAYPSSHGGALGGGLRGMMASCTPPRCRMLLRGRAGDSVEPAAGSVTAALIVQVALLSLIHLSNV